jgi:hypothetical protein
MNYFARGNQVFYSQRGDDEQLMLTVHPTMSSLTVEEQATVIARMFNDLPVVRLNKRETL